MYSIILLNILSLLLTSIVIIYYRRLKLKCSSKYLIYRLVDIFIYSLYLDNIRYNNYTNKDINILVCSILIYFVLVDNYKYIVILEYDRLCLFGSNLMYSLSIFKLLISYNLLANNYLVCLVFKLLVDNVELVSYYVEKEIKEFVIENLDKFYLN